jgi:predicted RNA-binding protein YlqC (UPF0109 family)
MLGWANGRPQESLMPTEQGGDVRQLVLDIAKALVDEPELVTVDAIDGPDSTVLELRVAQRDLGKVIGKQGRTARSLRTIIGAASMKLHKRHTLEIIEDGLPGGGSTHSAPATGD